MTEAQASTPPADGEQAAPRRPRRALGLAVAAVAAIAVLGLAIALEGSTGGPATGAAALVPADALAYVNVSLDRGRQAVGQSLALGRRFPDFPLAGATAISRLIAIVGGGSSVDFASRIEPWLGNEAALALLDTTTSTAGSLIVLDVSNESRARAFVRSAGATPSGSYRGTALSSYPTGSELAFVSHFLVVGQGASVRAAIDVADGASPSLASSAVYRRAASTEPAGRVLDGYASLAGVRRLLAAQSGLVGALGDLLYQPALEGVAVSVSPAAAGARIQIHSVLDPQLQRLDPPATAPLTPTLQHVMPRGSIVMFDVSGLNRIAPQILKAAATAGVAGGLGPLLSRLGAALASEGVNVANVSSIFHRETAVAIVSQGRSPGLVIVAKTPDQQRARTQLAQLEIPLAQLFTPPSVGPGSVPEFNDCQVAGITDHQLALSNGLQLNYAVFRGLVVISTSVAGIAAVARRSQGSLAADPEFNRAVGPLADPVTSVAYADFQRLLTLGEQTGIVSARYGTLRPDLRKVSSIGLTSARDGGESTAELSIQIP